MHINNDILLLYFKLFANLDHLATVRLVNVNTMSNDVIYYVNYLP